MNTNQINNIVINNLSTITKLKIFNSKLISNTRTYDIKGERGGESERDR